MGLFKKIFKRDLTPEEQERKSQAEKEWAEKCYKKGERFAEWLALDRKLEAVNDFANKYPKTFFGILGGVLIGCIATNYIWSGSSSFDASGQIRQAAEMPIPKAYDNADGPIDRQMTAIMDELKSLDAQIKEVMAKGSLTHDDSVRVKELLTKAHSLASIIDSRAAAEIIQGAAPAGSEGLPRQEEEIPIPSMQKPAR